MEPLISVIIPLYNGAGFIEAAVESIIDQPSDCFEIIISHHDSVDNSLEVSKRLAEKHSNITVLDEKDIRVYHARNKAIDIARGKYLAFMDHDDFFKRDFFTRELTEKIKLGFLLVNNVLSQRMENMRV